MKFSLCFPRILFEGINKITFVFFIKLFFIDFDFIYVLHVNKNYCTNENDSNLFKDKTANYFRIQFY